MNSEAPRLRVVRGDPTPEELAVIIALASVSGGGDEPADPPARGRWNDPAGMVRRPLLPGPGGWRAAAR